MRPGLRARLTVTYLLVTLAGMLLLSAGFVALVSGGDAARRQRELQSQAALVAAYAAELAGDGDLVAPAPQIVAGFALPQGTTLRLFDPVGTLVAASADLGPFPSRAARTLLPDPLPLLPISQQADRRYAATAIAGGRGVVEISTSLAPEHVLRNELVRVAVQATLAALAMIALVSVLTAGTIARPIGQLDQLATALAAGNLDRRSTTTRRDEIGALGRSLNRMADQLQARIADSERGRARLDAVLRSISEGVVALDAGGTPLFANPAALALLNVDLAGLEDRLRELGLHDGSHHERELQYAGRTLLASCAPVHNHQRGEPAAVLVLRDLTRVRALEQARERFYRSVSHELRTPLTALRGTIENLADEAPAAQHPRLTTLETEVLRLSRLVDALLNPPADGALPFEQPGPLDIAALVRELVELQMGRARRAGITLQYHAQAGLPLVPGDRDRLKQATLNLLDNALKFAPAGGHVSVTLAGDAGGVHLEVADDGPGLPPELGERAWERGVRGPGGGAGLGLALVREIVGAHGGRVWAEANHPNGTRMQIWLPGLAMTPRDLATTDG